MIRKRVDATGLLITIGIHVVVVLALLAHHPTRQKLAQVAPLVVKLIAPAAPQPAPAPPALRTPPRLAAPTTPRLELPQVVLAPADPVRSAQAVQPIAPSSPVPATAAAPTVSESRSVVPVEITPPVFNADYLSNPAPEYPASSRRQREQGRVILRVLVRRDGTTAQVQVRTSSGHARLDEAARDAVLRWKFIPAKRGAEPLEEWVLIPLSFRLES